MITEGVLSQEQADSMKAKIFKTIDSAYGISKSYKFNVEDWKNDEWEAIKKTD